MPERVGPKLDSLDDLVREFDIDSVCVLQAQRLVIHPNNRVVVAVFDDAE